MFVVSFGNKADAILLFYFHTHFHSNSVQSSSGIYLMNLLISEASVLCLCRVPICFLALVMTLKLSYFEVECSFNNWTVEHGIKFRGKYDLKKKRFVLPI